MRSILPGMFCLLLSFVVSGQAIEEVKIVDLLKTIRESKTPLVVNFWATYCIPCLEELPYFQQVTAEHSGDSIRLLLVSLDFKEDYPKIVPFAQKRKIDAPIVWLDETDADYFCPKIDSNWSGALPATLFINNKTGYRRFYEDRVSEEKLRKEIIAILKDH